MPVFLKHITFAPSPPGCEEIASQGTTFIRGSRPDQPSANLVLTRRSQPQGLQPPVCHDIRHCDPAHQVPSSFACVGTRSLCFI